MSGIEKRIIVPRIMLAFIASMAAMAAGAQSSTAPRIVVGIMIDGLDIQYIDMLRDHFGEGGFNRLLSQGVVIANADYGTNVDATAATSMVMTGAAPATTGITAGQCYNRTTMLSTPAMYDADALGNFTDETYSPRSLGVSTLADEVRIAGGGVTKVYSIAADASQSILLAGHSANAALWLNGKNGNWATSTYYKDVPQMLSTRNRRESLDLRLDTVSWAPFKGAEAYPGIPEHISHYPFRYIFARGNARRYDMFKASPMFNREVTDLAGRIIDEMKLGDNGGIDMINVAYTLQPYDFTRSDDNRYELLDSYLRLDRDLSTLFTKVESRVGPGHAVFFVAATPPSGRSRRDDERWGIPFGEFSTKKAKSLLNMYLIAVYGNGDWIHAYHDGQFYLNHKLISERNLEPRAVRTEAASFLARMSGVDHTYTIDEVLAGRGDAHLEALQRNNHPDSSGDLFIEVDPGWEIVDDIASSVPTERIHYVKRIAPATAPVFILAPDLDPRTIDTPVDIRVVAPTVARLLRIRSPNGASLPALVL